MKEDLVVIANSYPYEPFFLEGFPSVEKFFEKENNVDIVMSFDEIRLDGGMEDI